MLSETGAWCEDLTDSDRGDFRCQRAVDSSSLLLYILLNVFVSWERKCI